MEEVYKNIRKRRLELGMTQSELARLAGYENRSSIALATVQKMMIPAGSATYLPLFIASEKAGANRLFILG